MIESVGRFLFPDASPKTRPPANALVRALLKPRATNMLVA